MAQNILCNFLHFGDAIFSIRLCNFLELYYAINSRLLRIAHMDLTNENGDIYLVVAKNDSDTKISVEVRTVELNSEWYYEPDLFTSTELFF